MAHSGKGLIPFFGTVLANANKICKASCNLGARSNITTNYTVSFWMYYIATFNSGFKLYMAKS